MITGDKTLEELVVMVTTTGERINQSLEVEITTNGGNIEEMPNPKLAVYLVAQLTQITIE